MLLYHVIDDHPERYSVKEGPYVLSEEVFRLQMELLHAEGYRTIGIEEFLLFREGRMRIPDKPIIISFDDGHVTNYTAAHRVLRRYGFSAIFFVTVSLVGKPGSLAWEQVEAMLSEGEEIGSHMLTHRPPTELGDEELRYELSESKRILEDRLGVEIKFLSSPTGYYNKAVERIAREAGYKGACTGRVGWNNADTDPFALRRIAVKRWHGLEAFKSFVEPRPLTLLRHRVCQMFRGSARRCLGVKGYELIRSSLLRFMG